MNFSHRMIDTLPGLEEISRILKKAKVLAVDLEADSLYHYREKVCLLQIATEEEAFAIDPLAIGDLSPLKPIFAGPGSCKVFHGADYDIRSLYRDFSIEARPIFDTQLACRFLGLAETGLEAVLRNRFQVVLNKKFQKSDWSARPLNPEMLEYSLIDVIHLIPLFRILKGELRKKGRLSWVMEECELLSRVRANAAEPGPLFLRVKGASRLDPRSLAVLESHLQFRRQEAERRDLPPFKVLAGDALLEMAKQKPRTREALEEIRFLTSRQMNGFGKALLERIEQAMVLPEQDLPRYPERKRIKPPSVRNVKALKGWRDRRAGELALEPGLLINQAQIQVLAARHPRNREELDEIPGLKKWQKETFGREILDVLDGLAGT